MTREEAIRKIRAGALPEVRGGATDNAAVVWIGPHFFSTEATRALAQTVAQNLKDEAFPKPQTGATQP